jgi:hypothetical protein
VAAYPIGRLAIANAVIRRLRAEEIEIASLKVGTLEVGGRRWPETAGASEAPGTVEIPASPEASATPGALGTPVRPATPETPGASMGPAGDVATGDDLGGTGTGV